MLGFVYKDSVGLGRRIGRNFTILCQLSFMVMKFLFLFVKGQLWFVVLVFKFALAGHLRKNTLYRWPRHVSAIPPYMVGVKM